MRFGQPGELRPADTDGAAEHALSIVGHALQFRGPAGQHNLPAERPGETEALQRAGNFAHQLIEPLADDGDELRAGDARRLGPFVGAGDRSEEHTSELQSLMRISYAVFCLKKKKKTETSYMK